MEQPVMTAFSALNTILALRESAVELLSLAMHPINAMK
jgi:hypothetical protein